MEKQKSVTQHFTFISKVKPGRGKNIRAKAAKRAEISWEETRQDVETAYDSTMRGGFSSIMIRDSSTTLRLTRTWTDTLTTRPRSLLNLGLQGFFRIWRDFLTIQLAQADRGRLQEVSGG